jgi:hypothetical protein
MGKQEVRVYGYITGLYNLPKFAIDTLGPDTNPKKDTVFQAFFDALVPAGVDEQG